MGNYTPEQTSTLFLAIFFLIIMGGLSALTTAAWRLWAPRKRKLMDAEAAKHEADAKLADSLVVTTTRQTDLTERLVAMSNDHGVTLRQYGQILHLTFQQVQHIAETVGAAKVHAEGGIVISPAVEISPAGRAAPVVVAQEIIPAVNPAPQTPNTAH